MSEDSWLHIDVTRNNRSVVTMTTEVVDGVVFLVTLVYDNEGNLERKTMVRSDLVGQM